MRIVDADIHLIDLETRFPFKYGIATMTRAPHAFVRVRVESDLGTVAGIAADLLPPKWFTKLPDKPPGEEIDEMLAVIEHAAHAAIGLCGETAFDLWRQLCQVQDKWGATRSFPPLLSGFGTTLIERAVIEATCKLHRLPFAEAVRRNLFGIRIEPDSESPVIEPDSQSPAPTRVEPAELLPRQPRSRVIARHTIGMADALTEADIAAEDRLDDGLPQSLEACIDRYGLRHFKVKVSGDLESDVVRVGRIADVIGRHAGEYFAFTLDGNEQFRTLEAFRDFWKSLTVAAPGSLFDHLLFVEQPFHRDVALDPEVLGGLRDWSDRPPMIIDESDAEIDSLRRALTLGYHGTSHKNCKGVFKSIVNACLLEQHRRDDPNSVWIMSGEDLANVGPVALLQDLAVAATLGVESVERNGHHYFAGLSAFPESVQRRMLAVHGDLYHASEAGWPTLTIDDGELQLGTVNAASFGVGFELDVNKFLSVDEWRTARRV